MMASQFCPRRDFRVDARVSRVTAARGSSLRAVRAPLAVCASSPMQVSIAGAPASGKGTQCASIVRDFGLVHVSVGDLLRAEVAAGTENGKQAKEYMDRGDLVPNEVVVGMVASRLSAEDCVENGWLLDGYPRSEDQATALTSTGIEPELFLLLDVPEDILVERVTGRRLDPETGDIYHMKFKPPPSEEIAARLTTRSDDTEEACRHRYKVFTEQTEPVMRRYGDAVVRIDGDRAPDDVYEDIASTIKSYKESRVAA